MRLGLKLGYKKKRETENNKRAPNMMYAASKERDRLDETRRKTPQHREKHLGVHAAEREACSASVNRCCIRELMLLSLHTAFVHEHIAYV